LGQEEPKLELRNISEGRILNYGHCLIKKLWDRLSLDEFFNSVTEKKRA